MLGGKEGTVEPCRPLVSACDCQIRKPRPRKGWRQVQDLNGGGVGTELQISQLHPEFLIYPTPL